MMMQASDPGPTDTHGWNDLRCFPSQGESDCIQAEGVTNDKIPKDFTTYGIQAINAEIWVTFIPQDKAHGGFVDVFATDGTLLRHDAIHGPHECASRRSAQAAKAAFRQFAKDRREGG